ncbi:RidA family protein [Cupriavidus pauculus]|uniref:RidA family protein n=1 Tax=Cupriavidus pauculus TaxID=82633 RepID=UPI00168BC58C|nr:RidA family protein [Cupriavidus pauculus]
MSVIARIQAAGIVLPPPDLPKALYVPYTIHHGLLTVSGQLPIEGGAPRFVGKVPTDVDLDTAREAARLCVANLLGWVSAATDGAFDRVRGVVRLAGYVAAASDFHDAPQVINAASVLINEIFEERGHHARLAIGVATLPFNAPVEIEAIFALDR